MIYSNKIPQVRCRVANRFPKSFGHGIRLALQETRSSRSPTLRLWLFRSFVSFSRSVQLKKRSVSTYVLTALNVVYSGLQPIPIKSAATLHG